MQIRTVAVVHDSSAPPKDGDVFIINYVLLVIIFSVGYFILSSLVSGIYYVFKNPFIYMLAPLYALMHMFLLFPIRVYALLTINKAGWGTR